MTGQIYDDQIAPLMSEIIAICKEHQIPMVAEFYPEGCRVTTTLPFGKLLITADDMNYCGTLH